MLCPLKIVTDRLKWSTYQTLGNTENKLVQKYGYWNNTGYFFWLFRHPSHLTFYFFKLLISLKFHVLFESSSLSFCQTLVITSISGGNAFGQACSHSSTLSNEFSFPSQPEKIKGRQPLAFVSKNHLASLLVHCGLPAFLGSEHRRLAVMRSEWCLQEFSQLSRVENLFEFPLQLKKD